MAGYRKHVAAALVALAALHGTSAAARNYDCTKAGNANKAVCKNAAAASAAPAAAVPTPAAPATAPTSRTATVRHYDCTKAGNGNKTACKNASAPVAAAPAAPVARSTQPVAPTTRSTATTAAGGGWRRQWTGEGSYMSEAAAKAAGDRPDHGKTCS